MTKRSKTQAAFVKRLLIKSALNNQKLAERVRMGEFDMPCKSKGMKKKPAKGKKKKGVV